MESGPRRLGRESRTMTPPMYTAVSTRPSPASQLFAAPAVGSAGFIATRSATRNRLTLHAVDVSDLGSIQGELANHDALSQERLEHGRIIAD
jgi:hypothetical protein